MIVIALRGEEPLYQWDLDRQVVLSGDDVDATEVHFAPAGSAEKAMQVKVRDRHGMKTADIPNSLLTIAHGINVWTWHPDQTIHHISLSVKARNKPAGYIYTPTEVKTWERLEKWVKKELKRKAEAVTDYNALTNKPTIGGVTLEGDMQMEDFGIISTMQEVPSDRIKDMFNQ